MCGGEAGRTEENLEGTGMETSYLSTTGFDSYIISEIEGPCGNY